MTEAAKERGLRKLIHRDEENGKNDKEKSGEDYYALFVLKGAPL